MSAPQKRLTDVLLETGLFNAAQLEAAQKNARGRSLLEVLIDESDVVEDRLVRALSAALGVEVVTPAAMKIHDRVLSLIPADLARAHLVLPIAIKRSGEVDYLYLAMADPLDQAAVAKISEASGCQLSILLAPPSQLREAIGHHYEGKGVVRSPSAVSPTPAGPPPLPSKQDSKQNGGPATAPSRVVTGTAESGAAIPRALSNVAAAHESVEHWEVQEDSAPAAIHLYDHHTGDIMGSAPEGQSSAEGIEDLQNDLRNAILRSGEHEMPVIPPAIPPMPPPETTSGSGPGPLSPPALPSKPPTPPPEAETELSSRALPSDALIPIEEPEEQMESASTQLDAAAAELDAEFSALVAPVVDEPAPAPPTPAAGTPAPPTLSSDALVPEPPVAPRKKLGAPRLPEDTPEPDLVPSSISEGDLNAATVLDTPMFSAGLLSEEESLPEIEMLDPNETTAEELESLEATDDVAAAIDGATDDVSVAIDDATDEPLAVMDPAAPRLEMSDALGSSDADEEHAPFEVPVAPLAPGPSPFDALRNVRHTPGLDRTGIIPVIDWDREEFVPPEPRSDSQGKGYPGKNDIPESPEQARARAIPKGEAPPAPIPEAKPDSPIQKPTPPPLVEVSGLETAPPEPAPPVAEPASLDLPPAPAPAAAAIASPSAEAPAAPNPDEVPTPKPTEVPGASARPSDFPAAGIEELPTPEPSLLPQADTEAALSQSAQLPHSQTGEELAVASTKASLEKRSPSTSIGPPPSAPPRPKIRAEVSAFEPKSPRVSPGSERKTVPPAPSEAPPEQPFASLLKPEEQTDRGRISSVPVPKPKVLAPEAPTNPRLDASANDLVGRLLEGASLNSAERAQLVLAIGRVLIDKGVIRAEDLVAALGTSD